MLENGHWMQGNIRPFFIFAIFAPFVLIVSE